MKAWMRYSVILLLPALLLAAGCRKKSPEEQLNEALEALRKGDLIGVTYKCENIIEAAPESEAAKQARMLLAQAMADSNDMAGARETWQDVIDNNDFEDRLAQAAFLRIVNSHAAEGNLDEALGYIETTSETLKTAPDFFKNVQMQKAQLLMEKRDLEGARNLLTVMAQSDTEQESFAALRMLGGVLVELGEHEEAIGQYESFMERFPESSLQPTLLWGVASIKKLAAEEEQDSIRKEAMREDSDKLYAQSLSLLEEKRANEILPEKKQNLLLQMAQIKIEMGHLEDAMAMLTAELEANGENRESWLRLAPRIMDVYYLQGDLEGMQAFCLKWAEAFPQTEEAMRANNVAKNIERMLTQQATSQTLSGEGVSSPSLTGTENALSTTTLSDDGATSGT